MFVDQFRRARNLEESMAFAPAKSSEEHYNENQYQSFRRPSSEVGSSVKQRTHNILRRLHGRNVSTTCMGFLSRNICTK